MDEVWLTCPYCGGQYRKGNSHHVSKCLKTYVENLSEETINEWKKKYIEEKYSLPEMVEYVGLPYHHLQNIFPKIGIVLRKINEAGATERRKEKYKKTCIEHFGTPHNFSKDSKSRKEWEARLLKDEGITNVFQREEVKKKIAKTMLSKYGDGWKYQRSKSNDVNYYIEKYGEEEGVKRYNNICYEKGKTNRISYYIEMYGEECGNYLWEERMKARAKSLVNNDGLNKKCEKILDKHHIQYEKEFVIFFNQNRNFRRYDFKIGNLLIELNGNYWHCSPKMYKPNHMVKFPHGHFIKAKDKWEYDENKKLLAETNGYKIETIWEDEFSEHVLFDVLKKYNYGDC